MDKKLLRSKMKETRGLIIDYAYQNTQIFEKVRQLIADLKCEKIFTYVSMGNEVDTKEIISYYFNKVCFDIFVPFTCGGEMSPVLLKNIDFLETDKQGNLINTSVYQTSEALPDIALVPLLCYNKDNFRLGYGGGYYDRYLSKNNCISVGLAYHEQFSSEYEPEHFDIPLDFIITSDSIIKRRT